MNLFEPTGTKQTSYGHFADILKKNNQYFTKTRYLSICAKIFIAEPRKSDV